jgi:hypothetical protein
MSVGGETGFGGACGILNAGQRLGGGGVVSKGNSTHIISSSRDILCNVLLRRGGMVLGQLMHHRGVSIVVIWDGTQLLGSWA